MLTVQTTSPTIPGFGLGLPDPFPFSFPYQHAGKDGMLTVVVCVLEVLTQETEGEGTKSNASTDFAL